MSSDNTKKRKVEESKWEYSAPPIPTSHWSGFDLQYATFMENFLKQLKSETCWIRNKKNNTADTNYTVIYPINLGYYGDDEEEDNLFGVLLAHDDILLPHWKEFATALQLFHNTQVSLRVSIDQVQLTAPVLDLLTPALKGRSIKSLYLDMNEFEDSRAGIEFAVEIIKSNPQMETFYWMHNLIENMEDANCLMAGIINHRLIESVHLVSCFGGEMNGYDALCTLLNSSKTFTIIDLDHNNIQTDSDTTIPDCIARNPPLSTLNLQNNSITDDDVTLIARALKHNTNLKQIHLSGNNHITDMGHKALIKALFDSTNLNSVSDSNHTCSIKLNGFGKDLPDVCTNSGNWCPILTRGMKIYYILIRRHRKGSNVQFLNAEFKDEEDSLIMKLVPKVLESVPRTLDKLERPACTPPLSIMFELLRGWKMPELYETSRPRHTS